MNSDLGIVPLTFLLPKVPFPCRAIPLFYYISCFRDFIKLSFFLTRIMLTSLEQYGRFIRMKISLLTDAPKHNLALMKISRWYKERGDKILLNMPLFSSDRIVASILFEKNRNKFFAHYIGGPAFGKSLPITIEHVKPDYDLYPHNDFSLGYTFRGCRRGCSFCKVPEIESDLTHYSIWDFHDPKFKKICLLNNNTFFDPRWKETFEEIWDANLIVIDENGYDLRLIDAERAYALKQTRFQGYIHYAWDRMADEKKILEGLKIAPKGMVYVLIGFDTTQEEDLYRCQKINDMKFDPYVMPYNQTREEKRFKRFIDSRMYRKYKTIEEAWKQYKA